MSGRKVTNIFGFEDKHLLEAEMLTFSIFACGVFAAQLYTQGTHVVLVNISSRSVLESKIV